MIMVVIEAQIVKSFEDEKRAQFMKRKPFILKIEMLIN